MIIKEKVEIKLDAKNIQHYRSLGYEIPFHLDKQNRKVSRGEFIEVWSTDVLLNTKIYLKRKCNKCNKIDIILNHRRVQKDFCFKCHIKKYSIHDIQKIFIDGGCQLLSEEYIDSKQKLEYICECGNISEIKIGHFKDGNRCKNCMYKRIGDKLRGRVNNESLTDEQRKIKRNCIGNWPDYIKQLYNYTCQYCSYIGEKNDGVMVAHHLENYKWNNSLMLEKDNGICLCQDCHHLFHKIYGQGKKIPNTKKQMELFLLEKH